MVPLTGGTSWGISQQLPHVLLLSSEFPPGPGGIGTHAFQLALALQARDWRVTVVAPQDMAPGDDVTKFNIAQPFQVRRLRRFGSAPIKLLYRYLIATVDIVRDRPVLIVASGERMVWLAALLRRSFGIPFVAVGHAMEFNVPARWQQFLTKRSFEAAAAVVCVSEYTRSHMVRRGIRPAISKVIPNGADNTRFRKLSSEEGQRFRRERGLTDATLLITVGSVHERKGQDVVIRALPEIQRRIRDVHYVVVGMPTRQEHFTAIARELGVQDRVHFLGVLEPDDVVRALNAADLFVMASQHTPNGDFEGFGIAVVEAALCGRASVVSNNSGVMEAIESEETGLIAEISDPVSTAANVLELLTNRARLEEMGKLARERALAQKTWSYRAGQYVDLLESLVSERRAS